MTPDDIHDAIVCARLTEELMPDDADAEQLQVHADRLLADLAAANRRLAQITLVVDAIRERQAARVAELTGPHVQAIERYRADLRTIQALLLALDPKRRTWPLMHGTLAARVSTARAVRVTDPAALVAWCQTMGDPRLLRETTKFAPDLDALATLDVLDGRLVLDGEVLPGVESIIPPVSYTQRLQGDS